MSSTNNIKKTIVFRFDAGNAIGLGHLTRSLALASVLKDSYKIVVAIQSPSEALLQDIRRVTEDIITLPLNEDHTNDAINLSKYITEDDIVVLDGYNFDTNYQTILKKKNCKLVCIDDIHSIHFVADAVINHNPAVKPSDYSIELETQLYLGLDYLLLRKEFMESAKEQRILGEVNTAFICVGGSDPIDLTPKAIRAALATGIFKKINVVCGSAYKNYDQLRKNFVVDANYVDFYQAIGPQLMVSLLKGSQVAFCPSSSISFEIFCVGLNLVTGYYADNQKLIASFIENENLGLVMGDLSNISVEDLAKSMSEVSSSAYYLRQKEMIHGNSTGQIKGIFERLS